MSRGRGQNEGSITYRKSDKRWMARLNLGWQQGKRVRKCYYGYTREEVAEQLARAKANKDQGMPVLRGRQTIGAFLIEWLENVRRTAQARRTFESYAYIVNHHLLRDAAGKPSSFGKIALIKLRPDHIRRLLSAKSDEGKLTDRTIAYIRVVLRIALNSAVEDRLLQWNPAANVKPPKRQQGRPKSPRRALTQEEAQRFLAAAKGHRLEALFTVALAVGLRKGEALGLRHQDINFEERTIAITQQIQRLSAKISDRPGLVATAPKSESSRRTLILPETLMQALRAHKARQAQERLLAGSSWTDSGLFFTNTRGTPLDPRRVHRQFKALLKQVDLPAIRFHDLRHSAATLLLARRDKKVELKDIQDLLGHSQISLTADLYAKVARERMADLAASMDDLLSGSK